MTNATKNAANNEAITNMTADQRAWLEARGFEVVTWTPIQKISRNGKGGYLTIFFDGAAETFRVAKFSPRAKGGFKAQFAGTLRECIANVMAR